MTDSEDIKFLIAPVVAILRHDIAHPNDARLDATWAESQLTQALVLLNAADDSEPPLRPVWDKSHDQELPCGDLECGHPYYRHFDTYDAMYPVGCKYCFCSRFTEPDDSLKDLMQANINRRG